MSLNILWRLPSSLTSSKMLHPYYIHAVQDNYTRHTRSCTLIPSRRVSQAFYDQFMSPNCAPISAAQSLLETVHLSCGLPWWATIAVTTIALRTVLTLPLMAYSFNNAAKLQLLRPKLKDLQEELKKEVAHAMQVKRWTPEYAKNEFQRNMKRIIRQQFEENNCHPKKDYILPWIQIPLWVSMSLALRNMCGAVSINGQMSPVLFQDLALEGALWFPNLLIPDSTWILPVAMCLTNLLIHEMHAVQSQDTRWLNRILTYFMRGLIVIMLPIGASVPSGMCFYWTCSSFFGLGQNILLRLPKVRRALRIAKAPNESQTPFRDIWSAVLTKYGSSKNKRDNSGVGKS